MVCLDSTVGKIICLLGKKKKWMVSAMYTVAQISLGQET